MVITSFSCWSKTQQDRLNTRVNFGSAQPSKVDQFSVGANILPQRAFDGQRLDPAITLKNAAPRKAGRTTGKSAARGQALTGAAAKPEMKNLLSGDAGFPIVLHPQSIIQR